MNQDRYLTVIERPHFSEKSNRLAQFSQYVFRVAVGASKGEIKNAIAFLFKVEVEAVSVANVCGKVKRSKHILGKRKRWKKAYVKLKPGHHIDVSGANA
jgi:large subunit ribosomal protein L23